MTIQTPAIHDKARIGFGISADAYERGRPEYPADAITYVQDILKNYQSTAAAKLPLALVDLAAGTGKFTKLLAALEDSLVGSIAAVEPVAAMREKIQIGPRVSIFEGTAENIPLESASVDAVTVAQAFHWFDGERALSEIHRIIAPGGLLLMIWNVRDERKEWVREMTQLMDPYQGDAPRFRSMEWQAAFSETKLFSPLNLQKFEHIASGSIEMMLDRVASVSFVASLPGIERSELLSRMRELYVREISHAGDQMGQIEMPYETLVYQCRKLRL